MKNKAEIQNKVALYVGYAVLALFLASVAVGGLFWATGTAGDLGTRWWAVVATLANPVVGILCWRLSSHWAREHLAGWERGLGGAQRTLETIGRGLAAAASISRGAQTTRTSPANDDLLPKVEELMSGIIVDADADGNAVNLGGRR